MLDIRNLGNGHEITQINIVKNGVIKAISYVYYGSKLVWQAVRSCFGSGIWISQKSWLGDESWKYYNK